MTVFSKNSTLSLPRPFLSELCCQSTPSAPLSQALQFPERATSSRLGAVPLIWPRPSPCLRDRAWPADPNLTLTLTRYSTVAHDSLRGFCAVTVLIKYARCSLILSVWHGSYPAYILKMVLSKTVSAGCTNRHGVSRQYLLLWPLL